MKKSIFIIAACLLMVSVAISQDWVSFTKTTPEVPNVSLTASDNQAVSFTVEVCGMYKQVITEGSETFQRVSIPSSGTLTISGEPELPVIRQLVAIPECSDVILSVNITGQTTFSNYNIYPVPTLQEVQNTDGTVYVEEMFTKDATTYAQNLYLPGENAEVVSTGYLRGQKYAEVFIYPVQFNPVSQQLIVYTNYQITLSFTNPNTAVNVNTGIFNNVAANTMLNYVSSGITASINDNMQGNGSVQWISLTNPSQADDIVADYLIICADDFFEPNNPNSEVLRIANHRAIYNGFDVAILNAKTIYFDLDFEYTQEEYMLEQKLRTCIRRIYEGENAQHTYDGKLGYVLLIGDSEWPGNLGMPTSYDPNPGASFSGDPYPSDYYYSCLTSDASGEYDVVGDLYIGRFAVDNNLQNGLTELHNMVSKTIFYESEATFGGWRDETSVLLHEDFDNYIQPYFYFWDDLVPSYFTVDKIDANQPNTHQMIYDVINDGVMSFTYFGHGSQNGWGAGGYLDMSVLENNLSNYNKPPVVHGIACQTGWFDKGADCFGESLTTYSETEGFTGYLGSGRSLWVGYSTVINNPPNYLQEILPYSIFHDLSHITGEYILETKILSWELQKFALNYFGDPGLNIMAQGFEVTQNVELPAITIISTEITVKNGAQLKIPSNGQLFFENEGSLTIEEGASLYLMPYATITGNSPDQIIIVEGGLTVCSYASFNSLTGTKWSGINLNNLSNNYTFINSSFENCQLSGESKKLTVNNSSFTNSGIKYRKGDMIIQNSNFDNAKIDATNGASKSSYVEIKSGCTVQNCEQEPAIYIDGYYNFTIDDCTVTGNDGNGIGIFNSGGARSTKIISNNIITDNGWGNLGSGIEIYHSYVQIYGDQLIEGNKYGISCFNNSNISIRGNSSAKYVYETQIIRDNYKYQVYATQNSFPYDIQWNAIIDEDNQYQLVYYAIPPGFPEVLYVRNNYWGNNFVPSLDLYPFNNYIYLPVWDLNSGGDYDDAEAKYNSAQAKIVQEDYAGAKAEYQQIINNYPTSKFAQAALRELFSIEESVTDDYASLKTYYNTEADIQNNPALTKLAEYLTNFCEIKLENYPTAISWFENVIQNPESIEDSIFAIIDLGYTYFLMENGGLKSTYSGNLTEYIPESKNQFDNKRDYLISLLYKDSQTNENLYNELSKLNEGELLQNFPNPFSGTTKIWYNLENESIVQLDIYNYTGQLISSYNEGTKPKGKHHIDFDSSGLRNGIYFYSISINGQTSDTKKMTIIK